MELELKGHIIYLDKEDYHYFKKMIFNIKKGWNTYYLYNRYRNIHFHRLITNCPKGKQVDHINGNGLDNRKKNLRVCTRIQNGQNKKGDKNTTSKYKGVCWNNPRKKWVAQIQINGKQTSLGRFDIEIEAAKAYNYMALKHFGEYAKLNEFN